MKILVTGGAGYIGSFMVKRLIGRGDEVVVLDNLERGYKQAVDPKAELVVGDILNWDLVKKVFEQQFEAVIHFAGLISMEESMENPGIYFYKNTAGALNLIEHAVRHNVRNFIFSSTAGVYGNLTRVPIPEDHPTNPTNPYGESKLMVEKILRWYQKIYNLNFVSLRYFNAAGAALDGSIGENHNPETHIIPNAIGAALENKEFYLYGTDYDTKDGTAVRDYIHVIDLIDAHMLSLDKLQKDNGGFIYNVGTGNGHSNREIVNMFRKVSGLDLKVVESLRRSGDAKVLIADPTKIKQELGFSPKYSDLRTIVESAWKWHSKKSK